MEVPRVSVVIPVYLTNLDDLSFLDRALKSLVTQSYVPFQVIITIDYCFDPDALKRLVLFFSDSLNVEIFYNTAPPGISSNTNNGLLRADGDFVHVLHQDDYLASPNVYCEIASLSSSREKKSFLLTSQRLDRLYTPVFDITALVGNNRFGGPSGLIFSNSRNLFYDTNLTMLCDVDFLFKVIKVFGFPQTVHSVSIHYGVSDNQAQNRVGALEFETEVRYLLKKHMIKPRRVFLSMLSLRQLSQYFSITETLLRVEETRYFRLCLKFAFLTFKFFLFVRRKATYK